MLVDEDRRSLGASGEALLEGLVELGRRGAAGQHVVVVGDVGDLGAERGEDDDEDDPACDHGPARAAAGEPQEDPFHGGEPNPLWTT